jgi:choline dehydrogenase
VAAGAEYFLLGKGMMANTGVHAGAFVRSDPALERPDLQINFLPWGTKARTAKGVEVYPFSCFSLSPVHLRPEGRGRVHLKSPDPLAAPAIRYEFLQTEYDRRAILHGVRLCRAIAGQPALADYTVEEVVPGAHVTDDEGLLEDIRNRAVANYHPVGSCRMGVGTDAVVTPRLCVHGVDGLRVADASIMPMIVAGNTNAPAIMIGEKCAAMMLEDAA